MKGVMIPVVSAGSNHEGARETCTAHVISPSGAATAAAGERRARVTVRAKATIEATLEPRNADRIMSSPPPRREHARDGRHLSAADPVRERGSRIPRDDGTPGAGRGRWEKEPGAHCCHSLPTPRAS